MSTDLDLICKDVRLGLSFEKEFRRYLENLETGECDCDRCRLTQLVAETIPAVGAGAVTSVTSETAAEVLTELRETCSVGDVVSSTWVLGKLELILSSILELVKIVSPVTVQYPPPLVSL